MTSAPFRFRWTPTQAEVDHYSRRMRPPENIHTSASLARAAGFPRPIVQGHHVVAVALEVLRQRAVPVVSADVQARFVAPLLVGEPVELSADRPEPPSGRWTVVARTGARTVVEITVTEDPS